MDGQCKYTLSGPNRHASAVTSLQFLENGLVATSSDDGSVKLWDVKQGECINRETIGVTRRVVCDAGSRA